VLARIDDALTELGHDPQNLSPETLETVEHLHSGGLATTRDQAHRIAVTEDRRVLDVGCGIGGPARSNLIEGWTIYWMITALKGSRVCS
jgi:sarcosine/dimethylglycine N-methyltransferase